MRWQAVISNLQYAADYIHQQNVKSTLFGTGAQQLEALGEPPS